jgi:hypothetical protein
MADQPSDPKKKSPEPAPSQDQETCLKPSGEYVVEHHETPPSGPADKQIHPRRRLPVVPDAPPKTSQTDPKKGS